MNRFFALSCIFFVSSFAFSQTGKPSLKKEMVDSANAEMMNPVNISIAIKEAANKYKQPFHVEAIGLEAMENEISRTLPEALQQISGLMVQKTSHAGGSVYMRGLTGNQTLLLVDGIRLNNSIFRYGPNQYLNTVDMFALDRAEVALGGGSVQYGSDALGGVINALFHNPDYQLKSSAFLHAKVRVVSANQEYSSRVSADWGNRNWAVTGGLTFRVFGDIRAGGGMGFLAPSGYKEVDGNFKIKRQDRFGEFILAHQSARQYDVSYYHKVLLENFEFAKSDIQARDLTYLRRTLSGFSKIADRITITAGRIGQWEHRSSKKNGSTTRTQEFDSVTTLFTNIDCKIAPIWGIQSVIGVDLYTDLVNSTKSEFNFNSGIITAMRGLYPNQSKWRQMSAYWLGNKEFGKLQLHTGVRINNTGFRITEAITGTTNDKTEALVYHAAMLYSLSQSLNAYVIVNSGYRAPNIDDMGTLGIVDFRYELPQLELKPEYSLNKELGFKFRKGNTGITLSGYHLALNGLITRVNVPGDSIQGYPVYKKENIENAQVMGAECRITVYSFKKWTLDLGLSYTFGQNITKNEPMRRIPPLNGMFTVQRIISNKSTIHLQCFAAQSQTRLASGDIADNRIGASGTPGYVNVNFGWLVKLKDFRFQLSMQNLGDLKVKVHGSGVYGCGRNVTATLSF